MHLNIVRPGRQAELVFMVSRSTRIRKKMVDQGRGRSVMSVALDVVEGLCMGTVGDVGSPPTRPMPTHALAGLDALNNKVWKIKKP